MNQLLQDLCYSIRMLLKGPGFTAVAVITLALGIGANTAIFTIVNAVLLRPLPCPESHRLMQVVRRLPEFEAEFVSAPEFLFWQEHNRTFEAIAAFESGSGFNVAGEGEAERVAGLGVSADYFRVFGVGPALGRSFLPEEDRPGGERVVVLSDGLWRRHFGADSSLVGRKVLPNGEPHTVIGIMPRGFRTIPPADVWVPLRALSRQAVDVPNQAHLWIVLGLLKPGASQAQAQEDMERVAEMFRREHPGVADRESVAVNEYRDRLVGDVRTAPLVLLGAAGFVLLIACANKEGAGQATVGVRFSRLHKLLVAAEAALSLVLLVGAALLIQTFVNLRRVDLGFDPRRQPSSCPFGKLQMVSCN